VESRTNNGCGPATGCNYPRPLAGQRAFGLLAEVVSAQSSPPVPAEPPKAKIMTPQNYRVPAGPAQTVDHHRQPFLRVLTVRWNVQSQFAAETTVIHVRQFQRDQPQTHSAFPGCSKHRGQTRINVRLKIGWFDQALAHLILPHVVVSHFDRKRADAAPFLADFGKQIVRHSPERGFNISLVRQIAPKGFLLAK